MGGALCAKVMGLMEEHQWLHSRGYTTTPHISFVFKGEPTMEEGIYALWFLNKSLKGGLRLKW
jgi:hypothetical protein